MHVVIKHVVLSGDAYTCACVWHTCMLYLLQDDGQTTAVTTHTSTLGTYYGVLTEMGVHYDTSGFDISDTRLPI